MTTPTSSTWRVRVLVALPAAFALFVSACGGTDDDESATDGDADDDAADDDTVSAGGDRTGEMITVGYVNNEGGLISLPEWETPATPTSPTSQETP